MTCHDVGQDSENLFSAAVVGLAVFALVGNALALFLGTPRRLVQGALLVVIGAGTLYTLWRAVCVRERAWHLAVFNWPTLIASLVTLSLLTTPRLLSGERPSAYGTAVAIIAVFWLWFALQTLGGALRPQLSVEDAVESTVATWFPPGLFVLITGLAFAAYFMGPEPGDGYMAFRGSTTVAGSGAAILGMLAFQMLRGWKRMIALPCAMYLSFIATSRTGWILFAVLFMALLASFVINASAWRPLPKTMLLTMGVFVVSAFLVVYPAHFNTFYPYFTSRPGPAGARVEYRDSKLNDWQALKQRYERLIRVLPVFTTPPHGSGLVGVVEGLQNADGRWRLLFRSVSVVSERPWGHWPQAFDNVAGIRCGAPPICPYPHNLPLEIGFYFGWALFGIVIAGLAVSGLNATAVLMDRRSSVRATATCFLGYVFLAQLSGNLIDHVITLSLGVAFVVARRTPTKAANETAAVTDRSRKAAL